MPTLDSEADFDDREGELPLFVLWNEHERDDGWSFSTWVNWGKMIEVAALYEGPRPADESADAIRAVLVGLYGDLQKVSTAAVYDLFDRLRIQPSRICDAYWAGELPQLLERANAG